ILSLLFILLKPTSYILSINTCPTDDPCKDKSDPFDKVKCYSDVVNVCSTQKESMASQVTYLSTKIQLTASKIVQNKIEIKTLEEEIGALSLKIDNIETSLTTITGIFIDRIVASYKTGGSSYLNLITGNRKFSDLFNRYKYIQTVQAHDRKLLFQMQNSKLNFEEQKSLREEKKQALSLLKKQLEKEEVTLAVQKKEKEGSLAITKNSENIYKQNLEAARREANNIQQAASILSKAGVARHVSRGEVIGIMGNTGFSTGPHLHLSVYNLKESDLNKFNFDTGYDNPFNYLSSRSMPFSASSCDDVGSNLTKNIGGGSWNWPMNNPTISQCYGHTPWSWRYQSGIHNGVDMFDTIDTLVRAVDDGNAYTYRGGQSAGNGVFIFHSNGKMSLYWHLQ
ncbi:peptidoglycan DD-metalloendopeptidase family protein, partial [Candidatus Gottesmanbacteria bacterium]|nr:peptidoglycan DD-metalloendopeptidase family protein [Candidatus Gottesmanbacteria bacterium]